ncbi:MAG: PadR family transcriptional regulator [Bacillota bacterium]
MILKYIILGILDIKPRTGYDIKTYMSNSTNFFWTAELSQIYIELGKLEAKGFISSHIEPQEGKPDKKIYTILDKGKKELVDWLRDFPQKINKTARNEFLVRIFFSARIPKEELVYQLQRYIRQLEEELEIYTGIDERIRLAADDGKMSDDGFHQWLTLKRGIGFVKSEMSWARESIEEIQKYKSKQG